MVHLKVLHRPTSLASPIVAFQNSLAECCVRFRIKSQPGVFLPNTNRSVLPDRVTVPQAAMQVSGSAGHLQIACVGMVSSACSVPSEEEYLLILKEIVGFVSQFHLRVSRLGCRGEPISRFALSCATWVHNCDGSCPRTSPASSNRSVQPDCTLARVMPPGAPSLTLNGSKEIGLFVTVISSPYLRPA